jgi:hypothetical protein
VVKRRHTATWFSIRNESRTDIAFVRGAITGGSGGGEVLPIWYSPNDVSLFPGDDDGHCAVPAHRPGRCGLPA